jgi:hypothetical protein
LLSRCETANDARGRRAAVVLAMPLCEKVFLDVRHAWPGYMLRNLDPATTSTDGQPHRYRIKCRTGRIKHQLTRKWKAILRRQDAHHQPIPYWDLRASAYFASATLRKEPCYIVAQVGTFFIVLIVSLNSRGLPGHFLRHLLPTRFGQPHSRLPS